METRTPKRWDALRHGGLGLLLGLLVGALIAGIVYVEGREGRAALEARQAARIVEVNQEYAAMQDELLTARSFEALLRARIAAGAALEELQRLNFGLSRQQLRYAGVALADVEPARLNIDPEQLAEVQTLIRTNLQDLPPDAETQRERLQRITREIDALIPADRRG